MIRIIKKRQGFSLIEVLLGLAITAIIGLCVYNMFWTGLKLDDKMRKVHDNYMELLIADQSLTHDLENALNLDLSVSYPDAAIFDGQAAEFSFITQTPKGLKRVKYFSGSADQQEVKAMIGRIVNSSNPRNSSSIEYLLRQESSLADWLNQQNNDTSIQIVATGLKKGSFNCQYAPFVKDLHKSGSQALIYKDTWSDKGIPMAVSCKFVLLDPKNPDKGLMFKRDVFLAPVADYYNAQQ